MAISLDIPGDEERALREAWGPGLNRAAFEGLVIESYRAAKISLGHAARLLGLPTTLEAQRWLAQKGIPLNYGLEDLESDRQTLARLFPDFKP